MNIRLCKMTKSLCRELFRDFSYDPDLFADPRKIKPYVYDPLECDARMDRYDQSGRICMAIMLGSEPIGEVVLKNIHPESRSCTLGIHIKNDSFKNKGYGTQAERMTL